MSLFNIIFFIASVSILAFVYVLSDPNKAPVEKEKILMSVHEEPIESIESIIEKMPKE